MSSFFLIKFNFFIRPLYDNDQNKPKAEKDQYFYRQLAKEKIGDGPRTVSRLGNSKSDCDFDGNQAMILLLRQFFLLVKNTYVNILWWGTHT